MKQSVQITEIDNGYIVAASGIQVGPNQWNPAPSAVFCENIDDVQFQIQVLYRKLPTIVEEP